MRPARMRCVRAGVLTGMRAGVLAWVLPFTLALSACRADDPQVGAPPPQAISAEAVGHYCGMALQDHAGPKGQIFLQGRSAPVWFSSIKQVFAYTLLPEEPKGIRAVYVNDMAATGPDGGADPSAWIDAKQAYYVIGGSYRGGMGAQDAIPFSDRPRALAFAQQHGGRVVRYADMPEDYVFAQ